MRNVNKSLLGAQWRDLLPVFLVFVMSLGATFLAWQFENNRVKNENTQRFLQLSDEIQSDLTSRMHVYGQALLGSVGLFRASDQVTRADWAVYVQSLALDEYFPGIQGVSYNPVVLGPQARDQLERQVRTTDRSDFRVVPVGDRDIYSPVLYLEPFDARNERAIGYDIYSESIRRLAVDRAIATHATSMTGKIVLVQENDEGSEEDRQSGVLLILPVFDRVQYRDNPAPAGLVVVVLRMGDLMREVLNARSDRHPDVVNVSLYDGDAASDATLMFRDAPDSNSDSDAPQFRHSSSFSLFGQVWVLNTTSGPGFETMLVSSSPTILAVGGGMLSILLTVVTAGQAIRTRESARAAAETLEQNKRIQLLMHEVNHRSKNMLAVVRAIARQTASSDPKSFVARFSERIQSLVVSQDVLVANAWQGIPLKELVTSQLAHFSGLLKERIQLDGPDLLLNSSAAQTIGMALHELGTNASKHGALSNDSGTVAISWHIAPNETGEDRLLVSWKEAGGPPVTPPKELGFGSVVLGAMVQTNLTGKVANGYNSAGYTWDLDCPLHMAKETGDQP